MCLPRHRTPTEEGETAQEIERVGGMEMGNERERKEGGRGGKGEEKEN